MPEPADTVSSVAQTVTQTGLSTVGLFALLVALTRWIGGNFTKAVTSLETKLDSQKVEHKKEIDKIKEQHETCLEQHRLTSIELATLLGRMSAIDGIKTQSQEVNKNDKNRLS